jgi:DNA-directed RNA polymerase subunit beta'
VRTIGYEYATKAGISVSIGDMEIPGNKWDVVGAARAEVLEIESQYTEGLITDGERYNKVVDIWANATEEIAQQMTEDISTQKFIDPKTGATEVSKSFNPIYIMADSGARGSAQQMRQLSGMRGLMAKPSGAIIETPITANFREGLTVLEYFISTHGARKGLADTALKTANSGYLTRRLVDVANDCVVVELDCGTLDGIDMSALYRGWRDHREAWVTVSSVAWHSKHVVDPIDGGIVLKAGEEITESLVSNIERAGIDRLRIRSVLTCRSKIGTCQLCYGRDLSRGFLVNMGETVGVIAAQSIGEPGTQLTMRTFHVGGTASRRVEAATVEAKAKGVVKVPQPGFREEPRGRYDRHEPSGGDRHRDSRRPRDREVSHRLRREAHGERGRERGRWAKARRMGSLLCADPHRGLGFREV